MHSIWKHMKNDFSFDVFRIMLSSLFVPNDLCWLVHAFLFFCIIIMKWQSTGHTTESSALQRAQNTEKNNKIIIWIEIEMNKKERMEKEQPLNLKPREKRFTSNGHLNGMNVIRWQFAHIQMTKRTKQKCNKIECTDKLRTFSLFAEMINVACLIVSHLLLIPTNVSIDSFFTWTHEQHIAVYTWNGNNKFQQPRASQCVKCLFDCEWKRKLNSHPFGRLLYATVVQDS